MKVLHAILVVGLGLVGTQAFAADLKVLTAGAFEQIVHATAPTFEEDGGAKLLIQNDTVGALTKRIEAQEICDVAVLTKGALEALAAKGLITPQSSRVIARVGIGVAVLTGAPRPDIATPEAFKAALLAAPSVAYLDPAAGGSSGIYLADLFKRFGIAQQIAAKAVLVPGGRVADQLVAGRAVLGIHQISEILPVKGVALVGPLPAEIQNYTTYAAGVCTKTQDRDDAAKFVSALAAPETARLLAAKGMEPVR